MWRRVITKKEINENVKGWCHHVTRKGAILIFLQVDFPIKGCFLYGVLVTSRFFGKEQEKVQLLRRRVVSSCYKKRGVFELPGSRFSDKRVCTVWGSTNITIVWTNWKKYDWGSVRDRDWEFDDVIEVMKNGVIIIAGTVHYPTKGCECCVIRHCFGLRLKT